MPPDSALENLADWIGGHAPLVLGAVLLAACILVWTLWRVFEALWSAGARWWRARHPRPAEAASATPSPIGLLLAHLGAGLALAWLAVHGFTELAETLGTQDALARFDTALARSLHEHATPFGLWTFRAVAWLGGLPVMVSLLVAVSAWLLWRGQRFRCLGWLAALIGDGALNTALKGSFQRLRPNAAWPNPFVSEPGWSFPSGHAMGSLVAYGMLAYLIVTNETGAPRARRMGTVAGALVVILAIGFSRLYLTVHYFSDVTAGYLAGAGWLTVCVTGTEIARRRAALRAAALKADGTGRSPAPAVSPSAEASPTLPPP